LDSKRIAYAQQCAQVWCALSALESTDGRTVQRRGSRQLSLGQACPKTRTTKVGSKRTYLLSYLHLFGSFHKRIIHG
jgi:hypothetical protein